MSRIEIFISYAEADEDLLQQLVNHLAALNRQALANTWYKRKIEAGGDKEESKKHLNNAHIILLLLSSDFIKSDYLYDVEMQQAIERHRRGEAYVVPVLLRHVYLQGSPLEQFSLLPDKNTPVTQYKDQDQALLEVVTGVARIAHEHILQDTATSQSSYQLQHQPEPLTSMYIPSRVGNRGVASFLLNGKEHVLHYTRTDGIASALHDKSIRSIMQQTICLTYQQQELLKEKVPEFIPLKTIVKQHSFQIEGVPCLFTFKMRSRTGLMSVHIEVGGVTVFSH